MILKKKKVQTFCLIWFLLTIISYICLHRVEVIVHLNTLIPSSPECCCMWSKRRSQSSLMCTSWPSSKAELMKCIASAPCLNTRRTGTPPTVPWSSGWKWNKKTSISNQAQAMKNIFRDCSNIVSSYLHAMTLEGKLTCPPPSGNRIVSFSFRLKPFSFSFFPLFSRVNSAGTQDTTHVSN